MPDPFCAHMKNSVAPTVLCLPNEKQPRCGKRVHTSATTITENAFRCQHMTLTWVVGPLGQHTTKTAEAAALVRTFYNDLYRSADGPFVYTPSSSGARAEPLSSNEVFRALTQLKSQGAAGPDRVLPLAAKLAAPHLALPLCSLFNDMLANDVIPPTLTAARQSPTTDGAPYPESPAARPSPEHPAARHHKAARHRRVRAATEMALRGKGSSARRDALDPDDDDVDTRRDPTHWPTTAPLGRRAARGGGERLAKGRYVTVLE
uniref:Uncharacterized protein n=1 Tax=Plectus sambesii TaxID=2011161 RepID=A0A914XN99_9BILA